MLSAEVLPPRERPRRAAATHPLPASAELSLGPDLRVPFPQPLTSGRSRQLPLVELQRTIGNRLLLPVSGRQRAL